MRSLIALSPIAELLSAVMLLSLPAMAEPPSQQTGQATRSSPGGTETRPETSAAALLGTPLESSTSVNQNAEGLSIPNKRISTYSCPQRSIIGATHQIPSFRISPSRQDGFISTMALNPRKR